MHVVCIWSYAFEPLYKTMQGVYKHCTEPRKGVSKLGIDGALYWTTQWGIYVYSDTEPRNDFWSIVLSL